MPARVANAWTRAAARKHRFDWQRYVLAVLGVAAALVVRLVCLPTLDGAHYPLLLVVVAGCAGYLGLGPALLATGLATLAVDYFFEAPQGSFAIDTSTTLLALATFLGLACLLSALNTRLRMARERAEEARAQAEREVARRRAAEAEMRALAVRLEEANAFLTRLSFPEAAEDMAARRLVLAALSDD
jgi:two-component system sensor histidine kinase KdpD